MPPAILKSRPVRALYDQMHRVPWLSDAVADVYYRVERQLIAGTHHSGSTHPSIIHFSINKSATQFVKRILSHAAKANGMTPVYLNEYASFKNIPYFDQMPAAEFEPYERAFRPEGYLYSHFGGMLFHVPDLARYLKVLVVRDPRDVLTSEFFSTAYSHPLPADPKKAAVFLRQREEAQRIGVDAYVLGRAEAVGERYRAYLSTLEGAPNLYVTRYEEMIADFPAWLDQLLSFCALPVASTVRDALIAEAVVPAGREAVTKKRRQVTPGDHKRKLGDQTLADLNARIADILTACGYAGR